MAQWLEWLSENWTIIVVPVLVFLAIVSIGLWLRVVLYRNSRVWKGWLRWRGRDLIISSIKNPFIYWFILLGAYVAVQVSVLQDGHKLLAGRIIGTLFVASAAWVIMSIGEKLVRAYMSGTKSLRRPALTIIVVMRTTLVIVAGLIILDVWGAPVNPILLVLAVILFVAILAFRDTIPSYFSGIQLAANKNIKVGDFIKLDSGESGYVSFMNWQNTQIKSLENNTIIIPSRKLAKATVVNYGRQLKKATSPFHFYTRLHLREMTGLQAANLTELVTVLKEMPEAVVYYHVHHFLEEHLYVTPEPANDFAIWVTNSLGNELLGEKLASVDIYMQPNLSMIKQRLVDTIEDYLRNNPDDRTAEDGEEFNFMRAISFILPTHYVVHDLTEFVEVLKKVTIDSIYFHIYESKMRQQKGTNDFSIWMSDTLEEKELAQKIASIDPYVYTLEQLRARIIEQIEAHIS